MRRVPSQEVMVRISLLSLYLAENLAGHTQKHPYQILFGNINLLRGLIYYKLHTGALVSPFQVHFFLS